MTLSQRRQKLRFRSWHRGTREMDMILGSFADRYIQEFSESELDEYEELLCCSDPDLYNWYTGKEPVPEDQDTIMMKKFQDFQISKNVDAATGR